MNQNDRTLFRLRGKSLTYLREIVDDYLSVDDELDVTTLSQSDLIELISKDIPSNYELRNKINELSFSFKPSYYLMFIGETYGEENQSELKSIELRLRKALSETNNLIQRKPNPSIKEYYLEAFKEIDENVFQLELTWQKIHWYWAPGFTLENIYELQFGLAVIDLNSRKAIITCHNKKEKESIASAIAQSFGIKLSTLVLTQPLLDLIGSFDQVKKARYFVIDGESKYPENISYADQNLGSFPEVNEQENDPRFQRKESFYKVSLGEVLEQGIGVTSDSGKLWMPQILTVSDIRKFSMQLLHRISDTLTELTGAGQYSTVLKSLGISNLEEFKRFTPVSLRDEMNRLLVTIINMIDKGESERPFSLSNALLASSIPRFFNYPQIQFFDSVTESNHWYKRNGLMMFKLSEVEGGIQVKAIDDNELLNFENIESPISQTLIGELDITSNIRLTPTPDLLKILSKALTFCSHQIPSLKEVQIPIFRIEFGRIIIDIKRSRGLIKFSEILTSIQPIEIDELKQIMNKEIEPSKADKYLKVARNLREKCDYMNDDNCELCILKKEYICIRSLVGSYMKDIKLLAHKGIELSDIQGTFHIDGTGIRIFGFAKEIPNKGGLTARNHPGAVLLSQIIGQIDKPDFNTVAVISSSTLNEDLINRIKLICSTFNKKLILFDLDTIIYLIAEWERAREFESLDPVKIYRNSNNSLKNKIASNRKKDKTVKKKDANTM